MEKDKTKSKKRKNLWSNIPKQLCDGKIKIHTKNILGKGAFGIIYDGYHEELKIPCAVKFEPKGVSNPQLLNEYRLYRQLWEKGVIGIPEIFLWTEYKKYYYVLVMEKLGPTLEDLFNFCGKKFSLKTVLMLFDQLISRIEHLHVKHIIHRDIKPENFLMGIRYKANCLYCLDFGLTKKYVGFDNKHIPIKYLVPFVGTIRYASRNTHELIEQSRRDDLEAIGYVVIYFLKGKLPWQGKSNIDVVRKLKGKITTKKLCKGLPKEFCDYFYYVKSLKFFDKPDYDYLRMLVRKLLKEKGFKWDFQYDWNVRYSKFHDKEDLSNFTNDSARKQSE